VTNLHNRRSAVVTIRDRGPHGRGRIIDVSPGVARMLGMTRQGVARVEVVALRRPAAGRPHRIDQRRRHRSR
jgi:rare lipoprotein A